MYPKSKAQSSINIIFKKNSRNFLPYSIIPVKKRAKTASIRSTTNPIKIMKEAAKKYQGRTKLFIIVIYLLIFIEYYESVMTFI
jgi:hypothetical protein